MGNELVLYQDPLDLVLNGTQTKIIDQFQILRQLDNFPNEIISQILDQLPLEVLLTLQHSKQMRAHVINKLYNEIHFIGVPPRTHECKNVTHFADSQYFINFLNTNEDIIPQRLHLITSDTFEQIENVLDSAKDKISKIQTVEIVIERCRLTQWDLNDIISLPNLKKLTLCLNELENTSRLDVLPSLKELILLGQDITNSSNINMKNLTTLDISFNKDFIAQSLRLPFSLKHLFLNQDGFTDESFKELSLPYNLETLMMNFNLINDFTRDWPRNLATLDLSHNEIGHIPQNMKFPETLKRLLLSNNRIEGLEDVKWPPNLDVLKINDNRISNLDNVSFPNSITHLDLGSNRITSLNNFQFPSNLLYLHLVNNPYIVLNNVAFPSNLKDLNLDECKISNLNSIRFPPNLKNLSLSGNKIMDVVSYEHEWPPKLESLELFYNHIHSIDNWETPKTLELLDLSMNKIQKINTLRLNKNLKFLNLRDNLIYSFIGELPPSLKTLDLSQNRLIQLRKDFKLNKNLKNLYLNHNYIKGIDIVLHENLENLNLDGNSVRYEDFEKIIDNSSLELKGKKWKNCNKLHVFETNK